MKLSILAPILLAALSLMPAAGATITGINFFACTAVSTTECDATGPVLADTVGGNPVPNIYVFNHATGTSCCENSGNGANVAINDTFDVHGYAATMYFQTLIPLVVTGSNTQFYGVNIFLNGNSANPGISLFLEPEAVDASSTNFVNSGLTYSLNGTLVPGAGTNTYSEGPTNFLFDVSDLAFGPGDPDLVGSFNNSPDGHPDDVFEVSVLQQSPVSSSAPEPALWPIAAGALLFIAVCRNKSGER